MDALRQDLTFALRGLRRNPGVTLIAILALALGIGANTALFSVVNAVLLRPLPFPDADRLVRVYETNRLKGWDRNSVAPANFLDWQRDNDVFEGIAAFVWRGFALTGEGEAERLVGNEVSTEFFQVLGAPPALGRDFTAADLTAGQRVAVLSHALWSRRFAADPQVVGRVLTINSEPVTVIGVAPATMTYPTDPDLWTLARRGAPSDTAGPAAADPATLRSQHFMAVIARLKDGVSIDGARAGMEPVTRALETRYPDSNQEAGVNLVPLRDDLVGDLRPALLMLLAAVGLVLLIACANVAGLSLARATARQRELALRAALGARRPRLVRLLITESILLALLGGGAGLVIAAWGLDLLVAIAPFDLSGTHAVRLDGGVLLFTLAASIGSGLLFGILPALQASGADLIRSLQPGARAGTAGPHGLRLRHLLVVVEVGLTMVLLVGAGLVLQSFLRLRAADPGFDPAGVLTARVWLPPLDYPEPHHREAFYNRVLERLSATPGISAAGVTSSLPLGGSYNSLSFSIEGRVRPPDTQDPDAAYHSVSPGYVEAMGMQLRLGRGFTEKDGAAAPGVVLINEAMQRRFFPDEDPIGRRITFGVSDAPVWLTIVGVVGGAIGSSLGAPPAPAIYVPMAQEPWSNAAIVLRTAGTTDVPVTLLGQVVRAVDPRIPVSRPRTMDEVLSGAADDRRFTMLLLALFALSALVLSMVGVYGVTGFAVLQRTHEIGVRMAVGALRRDILTMVLRQGLGVACAGIVLGTGAALGLTRLIGSLLYGIGAADPWTFVLVAALLLAAAFLACLVPARRATGVDPIEALRSE